MFFKKKYSIIISGGGSKGAFSVGVLNAIKESNIKVTSVIGCSVGALNGAMFAADEVDKLTKNWSMISKKNPWYKKWTFGFIEGFIRGSLYDFSPILKWIENLLNIKKLKQSNIKFACIAINIHTGQKRIFTSHDPNLKLGMMASSAHQFGTKPVLINNEYYTDGGLENYIPIETAIEIDPKADKYIVISNTKIHVDHEIINEDISFLSRLKRIYKLQTFFSDKKELNYMKLKLNNKLIFIEPDYQLIDTLETEQSLINRFIEHGYEKGRSFF